MESLLTNNPFPDYNFPIEDGGGITWNWIMETCRYYMMNKELREENTKLHDRVRRLNKEITIRNIPESALRQEYRRVLQNNKHLDNYADEMEKKMFHNLRLFRSQQRFSMKLQKTNKELFQQYLRTERKIDKLLHTDREKKIVKLKKMYSRLSHDFSSCYTAMNNHREINFDLEMKIRDQEKQIKELNIKLSCMSEELNTYSR